MTIEVYIIEDTMDTHGRRITTMLLRYPRFIHSEFMTHRMFSRNASSSRAIPFKTQKKAIWNDPATFVSWGANQKGMQAGEELKGWRRWLAQFSWSLGLWVLWPVAWLMELSGVHKQVINRMLEPWSHISVLVTATEWENFFTLRRDAAAQPEIKALADQMFEALEHSFPKVRSYHLPFIRNHERDLSGHTQLMISAARCARLSYTTHGGVKIDTVQNDLILAERLLSSKHMSPFEHQAKTIEHKGNLKSKKLAANWRANFFGWESFRYDIEHESINNDGRP